MEDGIAVGAVVPAEGEDNEHIVTQAEAESAEEEHEQCAITRQQHAGQRTGGDEDDAADVDHAERHDLPGLDLHCMGIEARDGQRDERDRDGIRPCARRGSEHGEDVEHVTGKERERAGDEAEVVRFLAQIAQREQQIAQHPERQTDDDIDRIDALSAQTHTVQTQALEFARNNGETAVVIVPDHGNSGISLGRKDCKGYDKLTKDQLFHQFSLYKLTAEGFANKVNSVPNSEVQNVFRTYAGFELTPEEMNALNNCKDYKNSPIPEDQRKPEDNSSMYSGSLTGLMAHIITSRTCFGFTTGGHTGEEVFLAAYHPQGTLPLGMNTNIELNEYLCNLFGLTHGNLEDLTSKNFARHTDVFEDYTCEIVPATDEKGSPTLIVKNKKDKKKQLTITPFSNIVKSGKKGQDEIRLNSVVVYVDKNNTFYLPASLVDFLK